MGLRTRLAVAGVAAALLLTGCSSNTPGTPISLPGLNGPAGASTQQAAAGTDEDAGGSGTTTSTAGTDSNGSGSGNGGSNGSGVGGFNSNCLAVAGTYASILMNLAPGLFGNQTGTFDASQVSAAVSKLGGDLPDDLKADIGVIADAVQRAAGKSMVDAGKILEEPAVSQATDRISNWIDKNCNG
jgi:hypothetical protein